MRNSISLKVFTLFGVIRTIYWLLTKPIFGFMHDSDRYIKLSNQILEGNFDMDVGAFLTAPFYPWLLAAFKYLFGEWNLVIMSSFQIILEALSGLFLLKMVCILFGKEKYIYRIVVVLYALNPITFYYCYAIGQESIFQSTLIISMYFFLKTIKGDRLTDIVWFSLIFSVNFLTKSHVLLIVPFFILNWFWQSKHYYSAIYKTFLFVIIIGLSSLPNGLYNLQKHKTYTLSSDGLAMFLYYGNSEFAYRLHLEKQTNHLVFPDSSSTDKAFQLLSEFIYFEEYSSSISQKRLNKLPIYPERHRIYLESSFSWIKNNTYKWMQLKTFSVVHFLIPGINKSHASFPKWIVVLLWSTLLYGFGYYGLWIGFRKDKQKHVWLISIILALLFFAVLFGLPNRFRVITFEPFIILYAGFGLYHIKKN